MPPPRGTIAERLAARGTAVLQLVERLLRESGSPYPLLFRAAGLELGDVRALVATDGVEGMLRTIARAGVYVSFCNSRAYVETQACGRVLVASDIRAAREVILDGETGVLFRPGDVTDLTDKILGLAGAPERRAEIGRQARARIRPHALDGAVEAYEGLLAELVRPRPAATP